MPKFVTFDDGKGTFNFRAIFPANTVKDEIIRAIMQKVIKKIKQTGMDKSNFDMYLIKKNTKVVSMQEGKIYEPDAFMGGHWNDIND